MRWLSKIRGMTKREKLDAELDEELRSHLEMRAADEIRNGMNVHDAKYDAQRRFGNFTMEKERTRSVTIFGWLETSFNDVRFGLRQLRRNPGFAAVAVLTLALGIGANTAMFTLLDQVLLRMLPVKNPQQLVLLTMRGRHYGNNWGGNAISYPMFKDFQEHNEVFSGMFCRFPTTASLSADGRSELVNAELVSGTYFDVLGVTTAVGRTFTPDDNTIPDGHPIVILSYGFWKQRFAADPAIVGKTVLINNNRMTVIGVAQQGFDGVELGYVPNIFVPLMMRKEIIPTAPLDMLTDRRTRWVNAFGRLKPGITLERAKVALQPFMHSMLEMEVQEPAFSRASPFVRQQFLKAYIDVLPGSQGRASFRQQLSTPLWVLMAATGLVLLIACANIANLLLARATGRQKEIAVRMAIGASRARIVRQLLIETLSLSVLGALAGLLVAYWAVSALVAVYLHSDSLGLSNSSSLSISSSPDFRVLMFTIAVTIVTAVLFGLAPALQTTKPNIGLTLKDQAGSVVRSGNDAVRKTLVIVQVALSFLLVLGAGLFLRTLNKLSGLGPGFPTDRLVSFEVDPSLGGYTDTQSKAFYQRLTDNLSSVPGVRAVGLASVRILEDNESDSTMTVEGFTPSKPGENAEPFMNDVSPNYFATLGVPVIAGRDFTVQDVHSVQHGGKPDSTAPTVIIINETFAKKYFPGQNPLGRHMGYGGDPGTKTDMEIIGVVKDIKYTNLRDEIPEQAFLPYLGDRQIGNMTVYMRTSVDPSQMISIARQKVRDQDSSLPVYSARTMDQQISNSLSTERMIASLSSVFGIIATLLAAIGLYGVMAYTVARRTREIGIRMALGAERSRVIWMVMRDVLILIAVGVCIGLPLSWALTRMVQSQLFGVTPHDPFTMIFAGVCLATVACAAGWIPAFRASRLDPVIALRHE